jgi:hypothetical protein
MDTLMDLSDFEELKDFSGEITYTMDFDLDETSYRYIDPGKAFDIVTISINGSSIGTRWWGKQQLPIADNILKKRGNKLVIKVYNRLYNYCASLTNDPVAEFWIERNRHKSKLMTGLLGPVVLH